MYFVSTIHRPFKHKKNGFARPPNTDGPKAKNLREDR